jgi:uncharacterized membrane protein
MVKSNKDDKKSNKNLDEYFTAWMGSMPSIFVHTVLFACFLVLPFFTSITYDSALLILTTVVSLEAIYLALFIQISINRQAKDIEEIQEDVEDIGEDIEEVHEHVEELSEDVEEVSKDIEEISDDVEELAEDVEEIQDDMDKGDEVVHLLRAEREAEKTEEEKENQRKQDQKQRLEKIENTLEVLLKEIHNLRK